MNGGATSSIASLVIACNFQVTGRGAAFRITYDSGELFQLNGVGLVE